MASVSCLNHALRAAVTLEVSGTEYSVPQVVLSSSALGSADSAPPISGNMACKEADGPIIPQAAGNLRKGAGQGCMITDV